jgi:hypothetical protein
MLNIESSSIKENTGWKTERPKLGFIKMLFSAASVIVVAAAITAAISLAF